MKPPPERSNTPCAHGPLKQDGTIQGNTVCLDRKKVTSIEGKLKRKLTVTEGGV